MLAAVAVLTGLLSLAFSGSALILGLAAVVAVVTGIAALACMLGEVGDVRRAAGAASVGEAERGRRLLAARDADHLADLGRLAVEIGGLRARVDELRARIDELHRSDTSLTAANGELCLALARALRERDEAVQALASVPTAPVVTLPVPSEAAEPGALRAAAR